MENKSNLTSIVEKTFSQLPRGKVGDLTRSFGRSFVVLANVAIDSILTFDGTLALIESENTKKLKERSVETKYGVVGSILGYLTTTLASCELMYLALRVLNRDR